MAKPGIGERLLDAIKDELEHARRAAAEEKEAKCTAAKNELSRLRNELEVERAHLAGARRRAAEAEERKHAADPAGEKTFLKAVAESAAAVQIFEAVKEREAAASAAADAADQALRQTIESAELEHHQVVLGLLTKALLDTDTPLAELLQRKAVEILELLRPYDALVREREGVVLELRARTRNYEFKPPSVRWDVASSHAQRDPKKAADAPDSVREVLAEVGEVLDRLAWNAYRASHPPEPDRAQEAAAARARERENERLAQMFQDHADNERIAARRREKAARRQGPGVIVRRTYDPAAPVAPRDPWHPPHDD